MNADDRGQWPFPSQRALVDKAALQSIATDADEVLAMLKRANVLVASAALAIPHDETRAHAVQFVKESTALVRRIEGKR